MLHTSAKIKKYIRVKELSCAPTCVNTTVNTFRRTFAAFSAKTCEVRPYESSHYQDDLINVDVLGKVGVVKDVVDDKVGHVFPSVQYL